MLLYPVFLSSGSRHSRPRPLNTLCSAVSISGAGTPSGPLSRSTQEPSARLRTPLESNFSRFSVLQYRRRSLWKVVALVHPITAQPTVLHGAVMMSTRRCGLGFLAAAESFHSGSCHTTNALSSVSKPEPGCRPSPFHGSGSCPRSEFLVLIVRI